MCSNYKTCPPDIYPIIDKTMECGEECGEFGSHCHCLLCFCCSYCYNQCKWQFRAADQWTLIAGILECKGPIYR